MRTREPTQRAVGRHEGAARRRSSERRNGDGRNTMAPEALHAAGGGSCWCDEIPSHAAVVSCGRCGDAMEEKRVDRTVPSHERVGGWVGGRRRAAVQTIPKARGCRILGGLARRHPPVPSPPKPEAIQLPAFFAAGIWEGNAPCRRGETSPALGSNRIGSDQGVGRIGGTSTTGDRLAAGDSFRSSGVQRRAASSLRPSELAADVFDAAETAAIVNAVLWPAGDYMFPLMMTDR
jgi:hypothetical protein